MSKFSQGIETKRFLEIVDELMRLEVVDSAASFCRQIDFDPKSFSHIRTGKRNVPIEVIGKLYKKFAGNPVYIVSGQGEFFINQVDNGSSHIVMQEANHHTVKLESEVQRLKILIESLVARVNVVNIKVQSLERRMKK